MELSRAFCDHGDETVVFNNRRKFLDSRAIISDPEFSTKLPDVVAEL
jgi:hypothetical protein